MGELLLGGLAEHLVEGPFFQTGHVGHIPFRTRLLLALDDHLEGAVGVSTENGGAFTVGAALPDGRGGGGGAGLGELLLGGLAIQQPQI
jgi:hypothetical protein